MQIKKINADYSTIKNKEFLRAMRGFPELDCIKFQVLAAKDDLGTFTARLFEALFGSMTEWKLKDGPVTEIISSLPQ